MLCDWCGQAPAVPPGELCGPCSARPAVAVIYSRRHLPAWKGHLSSLAGRAKNELALFPRRAPAGPPGQAALAAARVASAPVQARPARKVEPRPNGEAPTLAAPGAHWCAPETAKGKGGAPALLDRATEALARLLERGHGQAELVEGATRVTVHVGPPDRPRLCVAGVELSAAESDAYRALAEAGCRLSAGAVRAEIGRKGVLWCEATVKRALRRLVVLGLATVGKAPRGYRLAEGQAAAV